MADARPDADVVVCSWAGDDRELTLACLRAVAAQAPPGRVQLVDMSPTRDLADRAEAVEGVVVRHVPDSAGLGASRQLGVERAAGRFVAVIDSDALPRPGWLAALRRAAEPGDVAVTGGPAVPVWPARRPPRLFRTTVAGDFLSMLDLGPVERDVPRVFPCNMLVDRQLTGDRVFAADMGRNRGALVSAEEIDMLVRVRRAGHRVVYVPDAVIDHRTSDARMSWRWMWRRVRAAGREAATHDERLEPLPRKLGARDRLFQAAVAPAFLWGRYVDGAAPRAARIAR